MNSATQPGRQPYGTIVIHDHGTLADLTESLRLELPNHVMKMAAGVGSLAISTPVPGPGGGGGNAPAGIQQVLPSNPASGNNVAGAQGGTLPAGPTGGGGTAGTVGSGGPSGTLGSHGSGASTGTGGGGKLPFTGYTVLLTAAVGASFAGAGTALRTLVRRKRDSDTERAAATAD
jgi:hypothetical protein